MYSSKPCRAARFTRRAGQRRLCLWRKAIPGHGRQRGGGRRTMMRPSTRRSVCSNSQICTFCRLCKNRKIKFCGAMPGTQCALPRRRCLAYTFRHAECSAAVQPRGPRTMGCVMMRFTVPGARERNTQHRQPPPQLHKCCHCCGQVLAHLVAPPSWARFVRARRSACVRLSLGKAKACADDGPATGGTLPRLKVAVGRRAQAAASSTPRPFLHAP